MSTSDSSPRQATLLGHPVGLYTLFFAEMWERFSFYGMRALLMFYMAKGFLGYNDTHSTAVYGAYTALVYMAPFFGGMLADRLLGARRAVVLGGLLMAAGHLMMTIPNSLCFFAALALLICGNGFFKPNISTIVGSLYPRGSSKRDGGFTIFYMGVNLGAALAPLLCGYIGQRFNWHWGFGLATIGMLTGVVIFVAPALMAQILIFCGSVAAFVALLIFHPDNPYLTAVNAFVGVALLVSAFLSLLALRRGGIPKEAGQAPDPIKLRRPLLGPISAQGTVYLGVLGTIALFVLLVSGFAPLTSDNHPISLVPDSTIEWIQAGESPMAGFYATVLKEISRPAGLVLMVSGLVALAYIGFEVSRLERIRRHRMYVVLILTFFSMLFWSFFEQAGSSLNNFTDRNVDRVAEARRITADEVGKTIRVQPTQEQVGYHNGDQLFGLHTLDRLREERGDQPGFTIDWKVAEDNVGMGVADTAREIPASVFQAVNPIFILILGLVFTAAWTTLGARGLEPSTPVKFSFGLLQLGLGFAAFWIGAQTADDRGMVMLVWLLLGYLLHTMGELCLSPVGLSMITKLSPVNLVSTVMGVWFLATAYAQFLAGIIAQFTGVTQGEGAETVIPSPIETVNVYGDVFGTIAISAIVSAAICFALSPLLTRWMHAEK
jgi:proton-dependent oligopeptide transporter, POT family